LPVKAGYLFLSGAGAAFLWSGIQGKSISSVFRQLAGGDAPSGAASTNPVASVTPASSASTKTTAAPAPAQTTAATPGQMSKTQISALWISCGGPANAAQNMANIAYAESDGVPSVVQQGEPAEETGYGLYQITPTSGITQNGAYGNLLNATNNTRAAIALYDASGYEPWSSDPVGRSLV
jgi:hypothetical protein